MALAVADQRKLMQLLAVSSSSIDGEALNAIRLQHALAKRNGLNLTEAIEVMADAKTQAAVQALDTVRMAQLQQAAYERGRQAGIDEAHAAATPPWRVMRDHALVTAPHLRPTEREFLTGLAHRYTLTTKQQKWLTDIYNRCPARAP